MGRDPFGLIVGLTPMPLQITFAEEARTPALGSNARTQVGPLLAEQIAVDLVLD